VGACSGNPTGTPRPPPLILRPTTAPRISRFSPASPPSGGGHPPDVNAGHTSPSAAAEAGEWSGRFPLWRPHPPRPRCAQAHRPRGQHGGRRLPPRSARWLGLSGATPFSYLLSSSPLSIPQFALRRHPFFVPALLFGMCLARVCRRCSGAPAPAMLWLPGGLALFLDIGMILRKVRGLFAKQPLFAQSRPSTLRSDGRDRGATWPLSLTVILARIRNKKI
jgi:hypothetical protein